MTGAKRRARAAHSGVVGARTLREKPMRRAHGEVAMLRERCARPTGGSHDRTARGPAQRTGGTKRRPRSVMMSRYNAANNASII
jgi:hypothetical protein